MAIVIDMEITNYLALLTYNKIVVVFLRVITEMQY